MLKNLWSLLCARCITRHSVARRQKQTVGSRVEGLEEKHLLTAGILFDSLQCRNVDPGATVEISSFHFKGAPRISHLTFAPLPGTDPALDSATLRVGTTTIDTDANPADGLSFTIDPKEWKLIKKMGASVMGPVSINAIDEVMIGFGLSDYTPDRPKQNITITGGTGPTYTVRSSKPQANLFVTEGSETLGFQYLLGGRVEVPVQSLNFRATGQDESVMDLKFSVLGDAGSIGRLELYRAGETTAFAVAMPMGSTTPGYTLYEVSMDIGDFVVPTDTVETLYVRPYVNTEYEGGVSGDIIFVDLLGTSPCVTAAGLESHVALSQEQIYVGTNVPGPDQDIEGNPNTVVMAELFSASNADPEGDYSPLLTGWHADGVYQLDAWPNFDGHFVVANTLTFVVDTKNVALAADAFRLRNFEDPSMTTMAPTNVYEVEPGAYVVTFHDTFLSDVNTSIPDGDYIQIALDINVDDAKVTEGESSYLWTSLSLSNFGYSWIDWDPVSETGIEYQGTDNGHEVVLGNTHIGS